MYSLFLFYGCLKLSVQAAIGWPTKGGVGPITGVEDLKGVIGGTG